MPVDPPRVGILETGRPPEELQRFGDYPKMVADWLGPLAADCSSYAVLDGELPGSIHDADLWVITGSRFGVYEDHPWIAGLEQFIRDCREGGSRMLGICFGHQVIAQALGGKVVRSQKGWGIGIHEYRPVNWPNELAPAPDVLRMQAFHQDQVIVPPAGARKIARSDFCEFAALWYPGFALTVQAHPEFRMGYATSLLRARRGSVLPTTLVDQALCQMDGDTTSDELAVILRDNLAKI